MNSQSLALPSFDFQQVLVAPWTTDFSLYGWMVLMGFLVAATCGCVGNYLVLRRMALVGDAISHSVLPGLVLAFLFTQGNQSYAMFLGAVAAAVLATLLIEGIHKFSRIKQDAAIGITFSSLFALGVLLVSLFADRIDLDAECVLHGDMVFVAVTPPVMWNEVPLAPPAVLRMGIVALITGALILVFYKELLVSSFDPGLAATLGFRPSLIHHALMVWLSVVVVSSFEAVGAILVIAMLILPGATASLITDSLPYRMLISIGHAALSSILGMHFSVWLDGSPAGSMVVMGSALFTGVWIVSPRARLLGRWIGRVSPLEPVTDT